MGHDRRSVRSVFSVTDPSPCKSATVDALVVDIVAGMPLPRVALTVGDPAGIGPEIVAKAAADPGVLAACVPIVYAPPPIRCPILVIPPPQAAVLPMT